MSSKFFVAPLVALCALSASGVAQAADDFTVTGTAGVYSDYRFRGISQTGKKPALQGGFTVAHSSGFYVGNWNSNVDSKDVLFNGSNLEMDIFGGYATTVGDFGLDAGVLQYYYPGQTAGGNVDTTEVYGSVKYGPALLKVSYALTEYFGVPDSDGTIYTNLSLSQPITEKIAVSAAAGFTLGEKNQADYSDYMVGVSYALPQNFTVGLNYHFNAGKGSNVSGMTGMGATGRELGSDGAVLYISKAF